MQRERNYMGIHRQITRELGPASQHPCSLFCDLPANQWAHEPCGREVHEDPVPGQGHRGWYCNHDGWQNCYRPACASCHHRSDALERVIGAMTKSELLTLITHWIDFVDGYMSKKLILRAALSRIFDEVAVDRIMGQVVVTAEKRKSPTFLSVEQKRALAEMRRQGAPLKDLVATFGISTNRAIEVCRQF